MCIPMLRAAIEKIFCCNVYILYCVHYLVCCWNQYSQSAVRKDATVGLAETGRSVVEVGKTQQTDSDNKEQHTVENDSNSRQMA